MQVEVSDAYYSGSVVTAPCSNFTVVLTQATGYTASIVGANSYNVTYNSDSTSLFVVSIVDDDYPTVPLNNSITVTPGLSGFQVFYFLCESCFILKVVIID